MDSLCGDKDCVEYSALACQKTLPCGHFCGGIADETTCLPCLHGCEAGVRLKQDADDMCMICFTEALSPVPSIQGLDSTECQQNFQQDFKQGGPSGCKVSLD